MATHHKFPVTRTAHVYTLGEVGDHIKEVWIVTHGYGQLASRFIHRFEQLQNDTTLIIAPEGLSRFYWGGFTGEVVSSWMTSGDRLDEIENLTNYMQEVYESFIPKLSKEVKINLLGFSQGCATQVRWILKKFPLFHNLIIWSGSFPEDISYHEQADYWEDKKCYFVYGTEDPFLTDKRIKWCYDIIESKKIMVETHTFEGKHVVDKNALGDFVAKMK
jgi:predicted esterase